VLWLFTGLIALTALGAALWNAPRWIVPWIAARFPGCLYFVRTERPLVALTIDDGPDSSTTPRILDELARHHARATFFLISERVRHNEALVAQLARSGHEIANHLTRDEPSIRLPPTRFERELLAADSVLTVFGPRRWIRPGSGWYNRRMLATMRRHGYSCSLGSVYPFDAAIPSSWLASRYVLSSAHPGDIIILHDAGSRGRRTAATLQRVLPELRRRGLQVVTLSELVRAAR
jgi:peptidoglycan/xylan/chitin deacetylase (PgdA/CDA1 family)